MAWKSLMFSLVLYFSLQLQITGQPVTGGARGLSLAHSVVALPGQSWAAENPAAIGPDQQHVISFFISRKYGLEELQINAFNLVSPLKSSTIALEGQFWGVESYRVLMLRTSVASPWTFETSRPVWTGVSATVKQVRIEQYGAATILSLSFGLLVEIWPQLFFAGSVLHGLQSDAPISFSEQYQTGFAYSFHEQSWLLAKLSKTPTHPPSLHIGIEYFVQKGVLLRTGMGTQPHVMTFGIEVGLGYFALQIAVERHHLLGWTPAISINASP